MIYRPNPENREMGGKSGGASGWGLAFIVLIVAIILTGIINWMRGGF